MSLYLAIELNDQTKSQLAIYQTVLKQNSVSGEFDDPTRFHITVRFLSEDCVEPNLAIQALKLYETLYKPKKFEISAQNFGTFDGDDPATWIGVNNCLPLYQLKHDVDDCLETVGYPMPKDKFPNYVPHITMGFGLQIKPEFNLKFEPGISIVIDNVSLWNGFKANDTYIANYLYKVQMK
jgi:2'-5' RNA ligase